jgi:hypothetical protein
MRLQRDGRQPVCMKSSHELDQALLTAVEHTHEKQRELVEEPPESPRAKVLATDVVQRAEDVDVLAKDARLATEAESDVPGAQDRDGVRPTD